MRMTDIILKKRGGAALTADEIAFFISGFTHGDIPDYQAAALLMAIWFRGMDAAETAILTDRMAKSGDMVDLSPISGIKVDKHSTGGVGDKTSLIIGPVVAACGVPVAKMSGRGLGHTGGTVDKLESIPGLQTAVSEQRFFDIVKQTGLAIIGQSGDIAPADKKLYALRDVTGTIDNLSLIASSIMSKKLAAGADAILLDVKTGSGAFMKTPADSIALAQAMVEIGNRNGRKTMALITDMDRPLGFAVGNSLEVAEAVQTLRGQGPADLTAVCVELAAHMLLLAGKGDLEACRAMTQRVIASGAAFERLVAMAQAQGGDVSVLNDLGRFPAAPVIGTLPAARTGYITRMDTEACGMASVALGAGRAKKEDDIDHTAGLLLLKKPGDYVHAGEELAQLHTSRRDKLPAAAELLRSAIVIGDVPPAKGKLIYARVSEQGVEQL